MNEKTNVFKKMTSFREFGVLVALLALVVIFAFSSPIFLSGENMLNITRQVSVVSLLAIGMTLVIVTGGIDLSVSAVIAAGGIITASAMRDMNLSIPVAIIMGLSVGIISQSFRSGSSFSRETASVQSSTFPADSKKATGRRPFPTMAWIFVFRPPRVLPMLLDA